MEKAIVYGLILLISLTDVDNSVLILIVLFVIMLMIIGLYPFLYRE